jgi:hypothetical protein
MKTEHSHKKRWLFAFFILLIMSPMIDGGQSAKVIRGKVIDKETGDPLPAYISIEGLGMGCSADYDGTFKIVLEKAEKDIPIILDVFQFGYKRKKVEAEIGEIILIELNLEPLPSHEVVVTADSLVSEDRTPKTVTLKKMDVYTLPGTAADPVYASQILPGINSLPDSSSMLIRGGSSEEVAYFFDGIEIAHPFLTGSLHESYFSIFDNQVIDGFSVSTSGFHARFGDALSGVMDIRAKDTISKTEGGIGLSILGLNSYMGIPLKNAGSFIGSFNWGNSALLTKINGRKESQFETTNGFAKLRLNLSRSTSLRILALSDNYDFAHDSGFDISSTNRIAGISLTSSPAHNLVTTFTFSSVGHHALYKVTDVFQKDFRDEALQARWDTSLDLDRHYFEFGADIQRRILDFSFAMEGISDDNSDAKGTRFGLYLSDKFRLADTFYLTLGGRLSALSLNGTGVNIDPRFSLAYFITRKDILRFSAGFHHQYGDYFTLEDYDLSAKRAGHLSLTYDRIGDSLDLRMTLYDKEYRHLFVYGENKIGDGGTGFARGAEMFIKWKKPKYDLLYVYNLLSSKRKENDVTSLATSPYEINHSFTGIFKYKFKTGTLGLRFSYATGLPYTPLAGTEWDENDEAYAPVWGSPYSQRYPSYQRMDINGSKNITVQKRLVVFYFGITNVLGRKNVLCYEYSSDYSRRNSSYSIFGRSVFVGIYMPFF